MMLYLFETRDIYRLMASKEKQGHEARTIISCLSCQPTKKEAADASNFIEFLDMSIEWIVTSDGLQDNFPHDFDLMMSHLFKAKKFFQSLVKASKLSVIHPANKELMMAAEIEPTYIVKQPVNGELQIFKLEISRDKKARKPINLIFLSRWPEDIAKFEMMNLFSQFEGFDRRYHKGTDFLELYLTDKIGSEDLIIVEDAGIELIEKLLRDIKENQILALTTNLEDSVLRELLIGKTDGVAVLYQPHTIKVSFQN